jgi:putative sterol carrier protein
MATATNVQEVFDNMCSRFQPEKAGKESATFSFDLTGDDGGHYWTKISAGSCDAGAGDPPVTADVTIVTSAADFLGLINKTLSAMPAFMQGRVKIQGNMGMALKMMNWFDLS